MCIKFFKNYFLFFFVFRINIAIYIFSGIKTLNKFLYLSRYQNYYKQIKKNSCSLSEGSNCYFIEKNYSTYNNEINEKTNKTFDGWYNLLEKSDVYGIDFMYYSLLNKTKNFLSNNKNRIDNEAVPENKEKNYLLNFDSYDEFTKEKDIYFGEIKDKILNNNEYIIEIKGRLRLTYDKDLSESYLQVLNLGYPSTTYGIIESKFISISFHGKFFICDYIYIKPQDKNNRKESIYFLGFIDDKPIFSQSYLDNKKRNEKWLKISFEQATPISNLVIYGPYDIDNLSFIFPNKEYDFSNLYDIYSNKNIEKLINDEDI